MLQQISFVAILCSSLTLWANPATKSDLQLSQSIDKIITTKLKEKKQATRPFIDDEAFCRRVHLDLIGRIPTLNELNSFRKDKNPNKRNKLINNLVQSKGYQSHSFNLLADMLRIKVTPDKMHSDSNYRQYVKESVRKNKPYDQFVRELITSNGPLYKPGNGATGFYARETMQLDHMASTVKMFLGMSLECSQCHDHPYEDWTQKDFYQLSAYTTNVKLRVDPPAPLEKTDYAKARKELKDLGFDPWIVYRESLRMKYASIYGNGTGYLRLPHDYQYKDGKPHDVMQANVIFGDTPDIKYKVIHQALQKNKNNKNFGPAVNSVNAFADWITSKENPMFSKALVNRLWIELMGSQLIGDPLNLSLDGDGPHPELSNKLVSIMHQVNFNIPRFRKILCMTKAYQRKANATLPKKGVYAFDAPIVRRLSAEAIWDSLITLRLAEPDQSISTDYRHDGFSYFYVQSQKMKPKDFVTYAKTQKLNRGTFYQRTHKEAAALYPKVKNKHFLRASELKYPAHTSHLLKLHGQSDRNLIDGASKESTIPQILAIMNGPAEQHLIRDHKSQLRAQVLKHKESDKKIETLWLSILSRKPYPNELKLVQQYKT